MVRKCVSVLALLGALAPAVAAALGLGGLTLHSYLNEPLRAEVDLLEYRGLDPSQIKIRLAGPEDFARAGVERPHFLNGLKFELELDGEAGTGRLKVTSEAPVREPFLDFLVEARWPDGRLLREYTVLLNPPPVEGTAGGGLATGGAPESRPVAGEAPGPSRRLRSAGGASDMPGPGGEYLVRRNDTLWSIARRSRPEGASIQQTMLDIRRLTPEAFIDDNINGLKAGYLLRLPTSAEISDTDYGRAIAEVARQRDVWRRSAMAVDARRLDAPGAESPAAAAGDERPDGLRTTGSDVETAREAGGEPSVRAENPRPERDNAALRDRMQAMRERIDTLTRMVESRDDRIAALQSELAGAGETAAPEQPEFTSPPAPPPPASGLLDAAMNPPIPVVGLAILFAAAVAAWRFRAGTGSPRSRRGAGRARSGAGTGDDEFAGVELSADDGLIVDEFTGEPGEDAVPSRSAVASSATEGEAYAARFETGDALAEADIYIAYGRFPRAADVLRTAIDAEPADTEYRLKLMQACIGMEDDAEFRQQYADLRAIGEEPALLRARALLDAVDGGEFWLNDLPRATPAASAVAAARETEASGLVETPTRSEPETARHGGREPAAPGEPTATAAQDRFEPELEAAPAERGGPPAESGEPAADGHGSERESTSEPTIEEFDPDSLAAMSADDDSEEEEGRDLVFAADGDEVATKLDLARAYLDMGDHAGARGILEEVLRDGDEEQQGEARSLLEGID